MLYCFFNFVLFAIRYFGVFGYLPAPVFNFEYMVCWMIIELPLYLAVAVVVINKIKERRLLNKA